MNDIEYSINEVKRGNYFNLKISPSFAKKVNWKKGDGIELKAVKQKDGIGFEELAFFRTDSRTHLNYVKVNGHSYYKVKFKASPTCRPFINQLVPTPNFHLKSPEEIRFISENGEIIGFIMDIAKVLDDLDEEPKYKENSKIPVAHKNNYHNKPYLWDNQAQRRQLDHIFDTEKMKQIGEKDFRKFFLIYLYLTGETEVLYL